MTDSIAARLPVAARAAGAARAGTGGPSGEGHEKLLEQVLGWTLVVLVAMLVTRLGLF